MKKLLKNKTFITLLGVLLLLVIGVEMGWISSPMLKNAIGIGLASAGAVAIITIPIWIIQKVWIWIKSKLQQP